MFEKTSDKEGLQKVANGIICEIFSIDNPLFKDYSVSYLMQKLTFALNN
jgi:hypothetical protein